MYWVHVYNPLKECVIHTGQCYYVHSFAIGKGTQYQGVNELKRDGGWFQFESLEDAQMNYRREWKQKGYILTEQCYCLR